MNKRNHFLGLLAVLVCSCGVGEVASRAAAAPASEPPAPREQRPKPVARNETPRTPLEYRAENDRDRVFIENAERAIGQYSEFIARAGDSEQYAPAVKRSREQIEDLQAAIVFVRAGAGQP